MVEPYQTTREQLQALDRRLERLEMAIGDVALALRRIAEIGERLTDGN